jgi:hypothetical protein
MKEGEKKPDAGAISGGPQKKIVYAVLAVAVVILAVILIAKFGYNTDLLNPAEGQMSLVQGRDVLKICPLGTTSCSGTCLNLSFDNRNCGSCGNACNLQIGGSCSGGTCYYPASDSFNPTSDSFNLQYLALQNPVQDENRRFTVIANVLKVKNDTEKNSISNVR